MSAVEETPVTETKPAIDRGQSTRVAEPWLRGVIQVRHLPKYMENKDVEKWLSQFGKVTHVAVWRREVTGMSTGVAYVEFATADVAKVIATKLNGTMMMGRALKLRFCEDIDRQKAKKVFSCNNRDFKPKKTPHDAVNAYLAKRWIKTCPPGTDPETMDRALTCYGAKKLQENGINRDWKVFESMDEALKGVDQYMSAKA